MENNSISGCYSLPLVIRTRKGIMLPFKKYLQVFAGIAYFPNSYLSLKTLSRTFQISSGKPETFMTIPACSVPPVNIALTSVYLLIYWYVYINNYTELFQWDTAFHLYIFNIYTILPHRVNLRKLIEWINERKQFWDWELHVSLVSSTPSPSKVLVPWINPSGSVEIVCDT